MLGYAAAESSITSDYVLDFDDLYTLNCGSDWLSGRGIGID